MTLFLFDTSRLEDKNQQRAEVYLVSDGPEFDPGVSIQLYAEHWLFSREEWAEALRALADHIDPKVTPVKTAQPEVEEPDTDEQEQEADDEGEEEEEEDEEPEQGDHPALARLSCSQRAVYDALRARILARRRVTQAYLSKDSGKSRPTVSNALAKMAREGIIQIEGTATACEYILHTGERGGPKYGTEDEDEIGRTAPGNGKRGKRRFEAYEPKPEKVTGLAAGHPALTERRTLFPTTVVDPAASPRLFVEGTHSRKLGGRITKGAWKGFPIYQLTLEERATCPTTCHHWDTCFGNGMHMARRHRATPDLVDHLRGELVDLQEEHPKGFAVRLHNLGDFFSVEYVRAWEAFLDEFPALHVWGYTMRAEGDPVGAEIRRVADAWWDRFAMRYSAETPQPQGATTIWRKPEDGRVEEGIVCPAETGQSDCCATCGLCWADAAREETIVFVAHGPTFKGGKPGPATTYKPQPPAAPAKEPVRPRTVSRGTPATTEDLVGQFLANGGQVRKVEQGASGDPYVVVAYLCERGFDVRRAKQPNHFHYRGKIVGWDRIVKLANECRANEGLEPLDVGAGDGKG